MEIDEEFRELVVLGPREAANKLRSSPRRLAKFASQILWLACPYGENIHDPATVNLLLDGQPFTTWILWLCTSPAPGEVPDAYIKRAQEAYGAKSHVCGRIWGKGYVAYRCRTCGMSPCSAICHECFEKGPHRNHNFLMYRSVAGGCCDCGDPGAWKPSGFCCDHKGPAETFHLPLPVDELLGAFTVVRVLAAHVAGALQEHYQSGGLADEHLLADLPPLVSKALTLVQNLCMAGDVFRRVVCAAVLEDIGVCNPSLRGHPGVAEGSEFARVPECEGDRQRRRGAEGGEQEDGDRMEVASPEGAERGSGEGRLLESLMLSGTYLSSEVSTLFLQMLFDFDFKKHFTRVFIWQYRQFMRTILLLHEHKEIPTRMVDISVQLFSNSLLTVQMIREERLLHTLFRNVLLLVDAQHAPGSRAQPSAVDCEHVIWTKRNYWPIANDLVNILSHRAVVEEFLRSMELVQEWLVVIRRFQGLDAQVRQMSVHVELESRHWTAPFFIELELVMEQLALIDSGLKDLLAPPAPPAPEVDTAAGAAGAAGGAAGEEEEVEEEEEVDKEALLGSLRSILAVGIQACSDWLASPQARVERSVPLRAAAPGEGVSLHIPLHRFVAFFASQLCRYGNESVEEVLGVEDPKAFLRAALQHPLLIQVVLAQIRAGMWRLNGETMLRRGWFYRSSYFYDLGFDLDLFVLQCAAVILEPDELLLTLLGSFKLVKFMGLQRPGEEGGDEEADARMDAHAAGQVAEDWLVLVAALLSERARLGLTDRECIRQEVLARLCVRPQSHSQLTESVCRRWHEHERFEEVLLEVAVYEPPKSDRMEQGKYRLKPELSAQYDASLIHVLVRSFNHGDYEAALDQARAASKGGGGAGAQRGGGEEAKGGSLMMPLPAAFEGIRRLLASGVLLQVVHKVLWRAVRGRGQPGSVAVNLALWLLHEAMHAGGGKEGEEGEGAEGGESLAREWGCVFEGGGLLRNMEVKVGWPGEREGEGGGEEMDEGEGESLLGLLKAMQGRPQFQDVRPSVGSVLELYARKSACAETAMAEPEAVEVGAGGGGQGGASTGKTPKDVARERQAAMLATFANQQRLFAEAQLESDEEEAGEEEEEEEQVECVICSQSAAPSLSNPTGLVCLAQRSNLLSHTAHAREGAAQHPHAAAGEGRAGRAGLHVQSCGHHIHVACFHSYFQTLLQTQRQLQDVFQREGNRIDLKRGLFLCPMCRQVGNVLVPVLPRTVTGRGGEVEQRRAGGNALGALRRMAETSQGGSEAFLGGGLAVPQARGTEGEGEGEEASGVLREALEELGKRVGLITDPGRGGEVGASGGVGGEGLEASGCVEALVGAVGTTVSCMELSESGPSAAALGAEEQLRVAHGRGVNHLRHVAELVHFMMARGPRAMVEEGERVGEEAVALLCGGGGWKANGEGVMEGVEEAGGGEVREGGGDGDTELEMEERGDGVGPGKRGLGSERGGLLGREVFEVLTEALLLLPGKTGWEYRHWLLRRAYMAVWVQAVLGYQAAAAREGGVEGMGTDARAEGGEGAVGMLARAVEAEGLGGMLGFGRGWRAGDAGLGGWVARGVLPFLRRAALLLRVVFHEGAPHTAGRDAEQEAEALRTLLRIPQPTAGGMELGAEGEREMREWVRGLAGLARREGPGAVLRRLVVPEAQRFPLMVPLPALYHDLYMAYRDSPCSLCGGVPHRPALCLCCGQLVCFASDCCRRTGVPGAADSGVVAECYAHSVECGAGTAAFVLLKTSMVLLIRETHWCIWGSPYLDAYGEEDPELKRGRPLSLNRERYEQLQLLHSTHGFDHNSRVASSWHVGAQRY